jgi:hypothetical protein
VHVADEDAGLESGVTAGTDIVVRPVLEIVIPVPFDPKRLKVRGCPLVPACIVIFADGAFSAHTVPVGV